jgi:hypothetical protein
MEHALTVEVLVEDYELLDRAAQQTGQTPEELAKLWLLADLRRVADDPLEKFIGAVTSNIPDLGDRHDDYLGRMLRAELTNEEAD